MDKNYEVLNELVPKTQELHRAIFDKGYEQGQQDVLSEIRSEINCVEMPEENQMASFRDGIDHALRIIGKYKAESEECIKVLRNIEVDTDSFQIGDQIIIGHYTATCQKVSEESVLFFMDQYDDNPQRMNDENTNEGGYENSDLRRRINRDESLKDFPEDIRSRLVPFENGDLIRIPTVGELYGHAECENWCNDDGAEQLPLMASIENIVVHRKNRCEWGWLQNKITASSVTFAAVYGNGNVDVLEPQVYTGVRRVFQIKNNRK